MQTPPGVRAAALLVLLVPALAVAQPAPELTFDEALRQASDENLDLAQGRSRLEQSRANTRKALAGYLPHLSVGASYTRNSDEAIIRLPAGYHIRDVGTLTSPPPGGEFPGAPTTLVQVPADFAEVTVQRRNQLGAQAELRQMIFAPTLWANVVAARKVEKMGELQYEQARRDLLFGVAQAWFNASGLRETIAVQERLLATVKAQVDNARIRVNAGASPKIDLLRAEIDFARAEQDLVRTQNAYLSAKSALGTLLGRTPDFEVPASSQLPPPPAPPAPEAALEQAKERPDMQAARVQQDLAEAARRGAIAAYLPTISAAARYQISNVEGFSGQRDTWALTLGLNWTIWDGGVREAQLREARAALMEADQNVRAAELRIQDELRRAYLEVESARANQAKAERQVELARESLELTRTAWEAGATTSLEVSNATAAVLGAELSLLGEKISAHLATLQVLRAAGAFDVTP